MKSKKIIIHLRLAGGLGNQLFQLFYSLSLVSQFGADLVINVAYMNDFSAFRGRAKFVGKRNLSFENLGLLDEADYSLQTTRTLLLNLCFGYFRIFKSKKIAHIIMKLTSVYYLDGYFMDERSFSRSESILSKYLLKFQLGLELTDACVVHVRAGDLLQQAYNPKCSEKYYFLAMSYMRCMYGVQNFIIISEDIDYSRLVLNCCSGHFNLEFINTGTVSEDFIRLCSCKYLIASNSTFSWWAGVLGLSLKFVIPEFIYRPGDKPFVRKELNISHT